MAFGLCLALSQPLDFGFLWFIAVVCLLGRLCLDFARHWLVRPCHKCHLHLGIGSVSENKCLVCTPFQIRPVCQKRLHLSPWWLRLCLFFACLRVGEASIPGPEWTLAVANMNGIANKAFGLADGQYDTWLVSETHLTLPGVKAFKANLRQAQSPYMSFVPGCPVAARSEVSDIGQWSGVGVLSKFPVRRLPHAWSPTLYHSSRLVCTSVCAHGLWVSGVVVYGTPTGPTHGNGCEVADNLLAAALERAEQLTGPRYVAGDFNHDLDRLATVTLMQRLGYCEVQDLRAAATGVLPQATCRGKTRRDFLFVSRELASLFVSCHVDDDSMSDHSYLVGVFRGGPSEFTRYVWPTPDPMEWEPVHTRLPVQGALFQSPDRVDEDYRSFWQAVENNNMDARRLVHKPCVRAMTGRAVQTRPTARRGTLAPVKASRPGDRQPCFLGSCLQHAQWTKQYRRLQSYVRLVSANGQSAAHRAHQLQLWTSIRGAAWWTSRHLKVGEPCAVPLQPPPLVQAVLFLGALESELSALEKSLNASRSYSRRLHKASDVSAMYHSVKKDPPVQVESLAVTSQAAVVEVDEDEVAVTLDRTMPWNPGVPILHGLNPLPVIHFEDDKVWLESCANLEVGDTLTQTKQLGKLDDLFHAFESQWSALWNRHAEVPDSQWDQILDFAKASLRPVEPSRPTISVGSIRRAVQSKSKHAATGLDGVSRADLLNLSDPDLATLSQVYQLALTTGSWPQQALNGYVRSLAKVEDPSEVGHFRPITVFSNVYRTWSSISARHWLSQLSPVVDPFLCGNTSGCRAGMVWRFVLQQVEAAHRGNGMACGFSADIVKAFNILPRAPALAAAKLMGVDHETLVAWAGALGGFHRHFVVQGSYSNGIASSNGFPEGCALSCVAMLVLTELFHKWLQSVNVLFRPVSYVDNCGVFYSIPPKPCNRPVMLLTSLPKRCALTWMPRKATVGL